MTNHKIFSKTSTTYENRSRMKKWKPPIDKELKHFSTLLLHNGVFRAIHSVSNGQVIGHVSLTLDNFASRFRAPNPSYLFQYTSSGPKRIQSGQKLAKVEIYQSKCLPERVTGLVNNRRTVLTYLISMSWQILSLPCLDEMTESTTTL